MPKPLRTSPSESNKSSEVSAPRTRGKPVRSAAEKLRIVRAADACARGELGAWLELGS
jgi:hypothetical protein